MPVHVGAVLDQPVARIATNAIEVISALKIALGVGEHVGLETMGWLEQRSAIEKRLGDASHDLDVAEVVGTIEKIKGRRPHLRREPSEHALLIRVVGVTDNEHSACG